MTLPIYAINLERSRDRWEGLKASADGQGLVLTRIEAVDGRAIPAEARIEVSDRHFALMAGRVMRPGEYGCYRSHLAALDAIVASGIPAAIIVEDDLEFGENFMARAEALRKALPDAEVIKLINHRSRGFRSRAVSALGDRIGRCLHGPQGSAACYLVTSAGAVKLSKALRPMVLPYDVDLERGWKTGAATFTVETDLARLGPLVEQSEIANRADYRATKLPAWQRLPTHLFRAADYLRRLLYAFQK